MGRRIGATEMAMLAEATLLLAAGSVAVRWLPFTTIGAIAGGLSASTPPLSHQRARLIAKVRWAVLAGARRLPWRPRCFPCGLAAQFMLRRRGIASTLYYGARPDAARGVVAHVWVRDGGRDVVGCDGVGRYAVLATFGGRT